MRTLRRSAPPRPQSPHDNDATLVAPDIYRLTFDNERVRMLCVHIMPGQGSRMHSHAGRDFRYPLTSGDLDLAVGTMLADAASGHQSGTKLAPE